MPIARYWVVKTGGNEVTEEMASTWRKKFLAHAIENGCIRGALAADDERAIAVSIWPDMGTMNAVIESDHYKVIGEAVSASWGAGGINIPDDIEFSCNGEILTMVVPEGL